MDNVFTTENAIGSLRVSSTKQGLIGDSPKDQAEQIKRRSEQLSSALNTKVEITKWFEFTESASGELEMQPILEALEFCKNPKNKIKFCFIKSIDRGTRGGATIYGQLKQMFSKYGVQLVDVYGVIGTQTVNTLSHLGLKYRWSEFSPTWTTELLEAERAKSEVRDILTRLIGAEINYVRMGYRVCSPPFGYYNEKVETPNGKRVIIKAHPEESKWVKRMFELRCRGTMTDHQIVEEINNLGFKTRKQNLRNPNDRSQIIGNKGNKPLSIKQFWRYIESPVYAGITVHQWTENKPVKGLYQGLVSYEMFNEANRGKLVITEENGQVQLYKRPPKDWQLKKTVNNPDFPYRRYVMCPDCEKPLFGSASKGRTKYYPAYHCNKRGHHFRVSAPELETTVSNFVKGLKITKEYAETVKKNTIDEWTRRTVEVKNDVSEVDKKIENKQLDAQGLRLQIRKMSVESVIKDMETEILGLENDIKVLEEEKEKKAGEVINMEVIMDNIEYYLASLEDLLLGSPNPLKRAAYFGVLFQAAPTYEELKSGTAPLEQCIALNDLFLKDKGQLVSRLGFEPRTKRLKVSCSTAELSALTIYIRVYYTLRLYSISITDLFLD